MANRRTKTLKFRRNMNTAFNEIRDRHNTVATDSVFGSNPQEAFLRWISAGQIGKTLVVNLEWEFRKTWVSVMGDQTFEFYAKTSHKYWLRNLIRRCR